MQQQQPGASANGGCRGTPPSPLSADVGSLSATLEPVGQYLVGCDGVNAMFKKTENYDQQHMHINDSSESSMAPAV